MMRRHTASASRMDAIAGPSPAGWRAGRLLLVTGLLAAMAGCQSPSSPSTPAAPATVPAVSSATGFEASLERGRRDMEAGNYGNAQVALQRAVDLRPADVGARLALAAAYDCLRRFDQSDILYRSLSAEIGSTATYLNNLGMSYFLRGDLKRAEEMTRRALFAEPGNETARNNLTLMGAD
ncbi:Flp pilus assembly protein TadD [Amorphus sp. MBR-141]